MSSYHEYDALLHDSSTHQTLSSDNCKVYKKRWFILFLFALYSIANSSQWMMYVVISNALVTFYEISYFNTLWTSMVFVISYLICTVPANYLINRLGVRKCVIFGLCGTCLGTWIKVASAQPSKYWILMLGQGIISLFLVLVTTLPTKIAGVWFSASEVSRASNIAVIGSQVGVGLGCMLASYVMNTSTLDTIKDSLEKLALIEATYSSLLIPIIILFFSDGPPTPPSRAQMYMSDRNLSNYKESLQRISSNPSFIVFTIGLCINLGMEYPLTLLMNKLILQYHPNAGRDVGFIAGTSAMIGFAGSLIFGYALDKYHYYKITVMISSVLRIITLTLFISSLELSVEVIYIMAVFERLSFSGLFATGLQSVVELTYPESENITCGISYASFLALGLLFTYAYTSLVNISSQIIGNIVMLFLLILSAVLLGCTKFDLRRQRIEEYGAL